MEWANQPGTEVHGGHAIIREAIKSEDCEFQLFHPPTSFQFPIRQPYVGHDSILYTVVSPIKEVTDRRFFKNPRIIKPTKG